MFLSNILNLFLIKQNWYLKKNEIHSLFQSRFDDVWNVILKNCTIYMKIISVKKSQRCCWNKMTLPSREFDDAAKAKNNSFKKNNDVCWKQNDYIIEFMIYNHWFVLLKMMIKSLNSSKATSCKIGLYGRCRRTVNCRVAAIQIFPFE